MPTWRMPFKGYKKGCDNMTTTVNEGVSAPVEPAHFDHGPSSAHRWLRCLGSINAEAGYPDITGPAADEGTAAHWLLEQCLLNWRDTKGTLDNLVNDWVIDNDMIDIPAGEETGCEQSWVVTGEMKEAVQSAINAIAFDLVKKGTQLWVESRVRLDDTLGLPAKVGGTCDIMIYLPRSKTLKVIDFKYGRGHVVEIAEYEKGQKPVIHLNEQAVLYALGALYRFEQETDGKREVKWVELSIIQPRAYHKDGPIRTHKTTPNGLMYMESELVEKVPLTLEPDAPRTAGAKQCNFCKAKRDCKTHAEWRSENARGEFVAELDEANDNRPDEAVTPAAEVAVAGKNGSTELAMPVLPQPSAMTLKQLSAARPALKWLEDWVSDVKAEIKTRLLHDLKVEGARLAKGPGSRPWKDEQAVREALAGLDEPVEMYFTKPELKSVAQIEKIMGKKRFKATLGDQVSHVEGGPVVVDTESDKPDYVKPAAEFEAEKAEVVEESESHPLL